MAGLLDKIARQVLSSLEPKKTTKSRPKTMSQTAYRPPVMVMPVTQAVKPVAPTVGPDSSVSNQTAPISSENTEKKDESVIITLEKEMTTENIIVENVPENVNNIAADYAAAINSIPTPTENTSVGTAETDDYLLRQIDEFRAKAQQLQNLLITKESKVQELQEIVDEREGKAKELEYILGERQRQADGITEEVTKQIDSLIDKVTEKMEAIGASLGQELQDGQKLNERQIEELKSTLGALNGQQIEEIKSMLGSLSAQQAEELKTTLSELNTQLGVVKADLSDKVHSENVKCYRNLADLLKSVEEKLDKANEIEKKVISVHKCVIAVIVLSVINMLGLTALALYEMGIFQLLFG